MPRYCVVFFGTHPTFRVPELVAAGAYYNLDLEVDPHQDLLTHPMMMVDFPSEQSAVDVCTRTVGVRTLVEVWGRGSTFEEVVENANCCSEKDAFMGAEVSFKMTLDAYGKKLTQADKQERYAVLGNIGMLGPVHLDNPAFELYVHENHGPDNARLPSSSVDIVCGRLLARGSRGLLDKFDLKKRTYLGTTSMEVEVSFLQSIQALAGPGKLCYDPFVGTGSLLITCAAYGASCFGSDIDYKTLRGKGKRYKDGKKRNVESNFDQYDLSHLLLGLVQSDSAKSILRPAPVLDCIVADPPYGIRAGAKKVGFRRGPRVIPDDMKLDHIPQCIPYEVNEMLFDMINFAASHLVIGGRLVYWLPTTVKYTDDDLPGHPCLRVVANSEQGLSLVLTRRLVTMEKVREPSEEDGGAFIPASLEVGSGEGGPAHQDLQGKMKDYLVGKGELALTADPADLSIKKRRAHKRAKMRQQRRIDKLDSAGTSPKKSKPSKKHQEAAQ